VVALKESVSLSLSRREEEEDKEEDDKNVLFVFPNFEAMKRTTTVFAR